MGMNCEDIALVLSPDLAPTADEICQRVEAMPIEIRWPIQRAALGAMEQAVKESAWNPRIRRATLGMIEEIQAHNASIAQAIEPASGESDICSRPCHGKLSHEDRRWVVHLRRAGISALEIARMFGVSERTVGLEDSERGR
jgi:hypothetical protein